MTLRRPLRVAIACVAVSLVALASAHPRAGAAACGGARWSVGSLADRAASSVNFRARRTSVSALLRLRVVGPGPRAARVAGVETTTYRLRARLVSMKLDRDRTIALEIADPERPRRTMVVRFVDPVCAGRRVPGAKLRVRGARRTLASACGVAGPAWTPLSGVATVTGVGFIGRTRAAPAARNGIELHPVLGFGRASCSVPRPISSPPSFFGVSGQWVPGLSPGLRDTHLASMQRAGIELVRADAAWGVVEPYAPNLLTHRRSLRWSFYDGWVQALAQHGLRWLPILDAVPDWARARNAWASPPRRDADFARFASDFAARYGQAGAFWRINPQLPYLPVQTYQVWNEENLPGWWPPSPDPERYADLFLATRGSIKAVDPQAKVMVGGLIDIGNIQGYLERMFAHRPDAHGNVDAVGYHIYNNQVDVILGGVARLRTMLRNLGEGSVPIGLTETGWTTQASPSFFLMPLSESDRAANYKALADALVRSNCGVELFTPHTWYAPDKRPGEGDDWFDIALGDGTLTPAGVAYSEQITRFRGTAGEAAPTETLNYCPS